MVKLNEPKGLVQMRIVRGQQIVNGAQPPELTGKGVVAVPWELSGSKTGLEHSVCKRLGANANVNQG